MSECPVCGVEISLAADTVVGELLECTDCGSELKLLSSIHQHSLKRQKARRTGANEDWLASFADPKGGKTTA